MTRPYDRERDALPRQTLGQPHRAGGPDTTRLSPLRDTGLVLGDSRPPRRRRRRRRSPSRLPLVLVVAAIVLLAALGALALSRSRAGGSEPDATAATRPVAYTIETLPDPTPVFATYRSLQLHLPVLPEDTTAVAFHQASGDKALHLKSLAPDADMGDAEKGTAQLKPAVKQEGQEGVSTVLQGVVLRMWRSSRSGKPDTACDVGGAPGTNVYAPVTGVVTDVVRYKLYGKYSDYEIHIAPDSWPEVDTVLIHVDDLAVKKGDRVEAGSTLVAHVRKLSGRVQHQLGTYTDDGGDHVHVQLNKVDVPGKVERVGES